VVLSPDPSKWLTEFKRLVGSAHPDSSDDDSFIGTCYKLCKLAYDERTSPELEMLKGIGDDEKKVWGLRLCYKINNIIHFIDRLANHFRAPTRFLNYAINDKSLWELLAKARVAKVSAGNGARKPPGLNEDEMDSFLKKSGFTEDDISVPYKKLYPRVHAEIKVLEHLYDIYGVNGKYLKHIGCSKPACFYCWLYILYHPSKLDLPASHKKAYRDWGLPENVGKEVLKNLIRDIKQNINKRGENEPTLPLHKDSMARSSTSTSASISGAPRRSGGQGALRSISEERGDNDQNRTANATGGNGNQHPETAGAKRRKRRKCRGKKKSES
jgi:hypothetical protein